MNVSQILIRFTLLVFLIDFLYGEKHSVQEEEMILQQCWRSYIGFCLCQDMFLRIVGMAKHLWWAFSYYSNSPVLVHAATFSVGICLKTSVYFSALFCWEIFCFFLSLLYSWQPISWLTRYYNKNSFPGTRLMKFLDILLQVPESISALNVSTAEAANHPAVLLSRSVPVSFVDWITPEILVLLSSTLLATVELL